MATASENDAVGSGSPAPASDARAVRPSPAGPRAAAVGCPTWPPGTCPTTGRCRPAGRSVREAAQAAGLPETALGRHLRPSAARVHIPRPDAIEKIAAASGCEPFEVFRAFALNLGYPWPAEAGL